MTTHAQKLSSIQEDTPAEFQELLLSVEALPAPHRESVLNATHRVVEGAVRRRRILNLVQEALSQLRLDMKYLVFDLEATRRERDSLKKQIEGAD